MQLYQEKDKEYFRQIRKELIALIEGKDNRILEIGCAEGQTGAELKRQGKAKEIIGIELVEEAARVARQYLDQVIVGDIEKLELPFPQEHFDYILMGDVLEHLIDPWSCLKKLRPYLKKEGRLVASIPNVNHIRVIFDLIVRDRWEYQGGGGLLDKTHLRFFTNKSIRAIFEDCGYHIVQIDRVSTPRKWVKVLNSASLGIFKRFLTYQFLMVARKSL